MEKKVSERNRMSTGFEKLRLLRGFKLCEEPDLNFTVTNKWCVRNLGSGEVAVAVSDLMCK